MISSGSQGWLKNKQQSWHHLETCQKCNFLSSTCLLKGSDAWKFEKPCSSLIYDQKFPTICRFEEFSLRITPGAYKQYHCLVLPPKSHPKVWNGAWTLAFWEVSQVSLNSTQMWITVAAFLALSLVKQMWRQSDKSPKLCPCCLWYC
jgi:hypothetical protein